ncbi:hypothetical protein [Brevibacillus fortis]|uniref:hypothetical protein n=1 Tax=Brevibacillus fortis TaxID=2126352 RepID=UPI0038FCCC41
MITKARNDFIYVGNHYLDIFTSNIQQGGTIESMCVSEEPDSNIRYVEIVTTYSEEIRTIENLKYINGKLDKWEITVNDSIAETVFDRENFYLLYSML